MKDIVGVKFRKPGKIYFFDANGLKIDKNQKVIAETALGDEFGTVVICSKKINPENEFRDDLSRGEFNISGLCQSCQDDFFKEVESL